MRRPGTIAVLCSVCLRFICPVRAPARHPESGNRKSQGGKKDRVRRWRRRRVERGGLADSDRRRRVRVPLSAPARPMPQITQANKSFNPHVLVIQVGTEVRFPNKDPFLHNVFSLFDGKRFDLGFYEAGSSKTVHFDRAGVSFLFCNIHPEMSAAVVVVDTPYFASSDRTGRVSIPNVPDGRYQLNVWYERSLQADLKSASRVVTISDASRSLEPFRVIENPNFTFEHKNKYGQDYVPPANTSPSYGHP